MDAQEKLKQLAEASRYDLSCACGTPKDDHRQRNRDGTWLYPASLPNGGKSILLKTLMSSACTNDCRYCPLRQNMDVVRRCTLGPEELAEQFMGYVRYQGIHGMFLSSGVMRDADYTMDRMIATAEILRNKYQYRGYLHMKIIPGASDAAIETMLSLASAVSLNVEAPTRRTFETLSRRKNFDHDIVRPMKLISQLTGPGGPYRQVRQTTQFIVGAADENDREIVQATYGMYRRLRLDRVYFSAYQQGLGDANLPGEQRSPSNAGDGLTREHRLYQADFLMRKYGFEADEIPFESDNNLPLHTDPKLRWAQLHPERFPIDLNRAGKKDLLRIPGFGPLTAERVLLLQSHGERVRSLSELGLKGVRLEKSLPYVQFGHRRPIFTRPIPFPENK